MMKLLDLTLDTPEENLALDEALLDEAEAAGRPSETLRLWHPKGQFVVLGRSCKADSEVHLDECRRRAIGVYRRSSGGGTIVTGPGCLMYAVILSYERRPQLRPLSAAHEFVMDTMRRAVSTPDLVERTRLSTSSIQFQGTSDLAIGDRKFSGNSMRAKRDHFLYHGTLLFGFPLELITACLATPPRQPDYRQDRAHDAFVTHLPVTENELRRAITAAWHASEPLGDWPRERVRELVAEKYSRDEWNLRY